MSRHVRLSVVLRLREREEDAARANLATALAGHHRASAAHDRATERVAERLTDLTDVHLEGGPADRLITAARHLIGAGRQREAEARRVETAAHVLLDVRSRLSEASRRREVVERLRDRILAEERLAAARLEQAETNELASTRHAWRTIPEVDQ
jgi:flagellar export protein FliJ